MSNEIVNRVANSNLITIDLADYSPKKSIIEFDIKDFLFNGIVLKEKEFRTALKELGFSKYQDKTIALFCSSDAIIPMWAYMLVTSYLNPISTVYFGTKKEVFNNLLLANIENINADDYTNAKVIVKGCGHIPISEQMYIAITKKLQNNVSSLMFGEACSAVPVFKKKK